MKHHDCFVLTLVLLFVTRISAQFTFPPLIVHVKCDGNEQKTVTAVTFQAAGKFIYIAGCASTDGEFNGNGIPSSFYEVTFDDCNIEWDVKYQIVLAEFQGMVLGSDLGSLVEFTCVKVTEPLTNSLAMSVSPGTATVSLEDSVQPTTTMKFSNGADNKDGSAVTSATLGELLRLHIYIPDNFLGGANGFDIMVKTITVTVGTVSLVLTGNDGSAGTSDGCKAKSYWGEVTDQGQGYVRVEFNAFMIGGTLSHTQTFSAVIEVCAGENCPNYVCTQGSAAQAGRRRRDASNDTIVEEVNVSGRLKILPYAVGFAKDVAGKEPQTTDVRKCEQCTNDALYAVMGTLATAILISFAISLFLFTRYKHMSRVSHPMGIIPGKTDKTPNA